MPAPQPALTKINKGNKAVSLKLNSFRFRLSILSKSFPLFRMALIHTANIILIGFALLFSSVVWAESSIASSLRLPPKKTLSGIRVASDNSIENESTPTPAPSSSPNESNHANTENPEPAKEIKVRLYIEPKDSKAEAQAADNLVNELKKNCQKHFFGQLQSEVRAACSSAGRDYLRLSKMGRSLPITRCRLNYGEEPRLVMACLIGANIVDELNSGIEHFKKKLQLCNENYPSHNAIDEVFLESCLTGIYIPNFMNAGRLERFEVCAQITPERSFIGPCAVGLSLAQDSDLKVSPAQQNKMCDKYFNLNRFHKGYRACLNARSLGPQVPSKYAEALRGCTNVVSEANNDTERAACLVGIAIYRHLERNEDVSKRFQKCGDAKVTYQERDVLACLTAASLLDFTDKNGAESGCKEVFKELKSHSRNDCLKSVATF